MLLCRRYRREKKMYGVEMLSGLFGECSSGVGITSVVVQKGELNTNKLGKQVVLHACIGGDEEPMTMN